MNHAIIIVVETDAGRRCSVRMVNHTAGGFTSIDAAYDYLISAGATSIEVIK